MKTYDVAIIGAGPAGSMLARGLEKTGLKIAMFDFRPLDRTFMKGYPLKSCGGLLAPDAQKFLLKKGIDVPEDVKVSIQSPWVKTTDLGANITCFYKRNYINIDREKFDRFLAKGISVDKYFGVKVNRIEKDDGFVINGEIKARILVGADGANSVVRKKFFPEFKAREYVSIQEHFADDTLQDFECFFDAELSDYYGWRYSKENGFVLGLALQKESGYLEKYEKFKNKAGFGKGLAKEGAFILRPNFLHRVYAENNVFLIGEAGGYISPSSAEGISFAMKTAEILAQSNFDVRVFKRKMRPILLSIFLKNIKGFFMYNPWLRKLIMAGSRKRPITGKSLK